MTTKKEAAIEAVEAVTPYEMAGAGDVERVGAVAGGTFLRRIRDDVVEMLSCADADDFEPDALYDRLSYDGLDHEIADGAVPIYNSDRFDVLHELNAYYVDISDYGRPDDMVQYAGWILYEVARGVVYHLIQVAQDAADEIEEVEATEACRFCGHDIGQDDEGRWVAPDAGHNRENGDGIWRETCPDNDTELAAPHEPTD